MVKCTIANSLFVECSVYLLRVNASLSIVVTFVVTGVLGGVLVLQSKSRE